MKKIFVFFVIVGFLLILAALILRISQIPIIISAKALKASSLLILANTSFILALLFKK
jgi:hypothetical protein